MFRRSFSTAVNMMAAETHVTCSTLAASATCTGSTLKQRVLENDTHRELGFADRAVKMTTRTSFFSSGSSNTADQQQQQQATSFIASQDGQRLGVSTGSQSVKSMRKYLRSNNMEDIHGGCDWTVLSCTPTSASFSGNNSSNLQFCVAASQKGSTCSTTVCRGGSGNVAYHSQPSISTVETNYFYARPNDFVMMHSTKNSSSSAVASAAANHAKEVFQAAVRQAAISSNTVRSQQKESNNNTPQQQPQKQHVDVESLAEEVLSALKKYGEHHATVIVARLGHINTEASQPPCTA